MKHWGFESSKTHQTHQTGDEVWERSYPSVGALTQFLLNQKLLDLKPYTGFEAQSGGANFRCITLSQRILPELTILHR